MSFQWQTRDDAAQTLGVDVGTLQSWIDDGRAPSRSGKHGVEVLIEFPEENDDEPVEAERDAEAANVVEAAATSPSSGGALEVVSRRELQLAGGIAAAWQRLAEQSDHELVRARRMGAAAWSLVAAMAAVGGVGIWWGTHATLTARADAELTRTNLSHVTGESGDQRQQIEQMSARLAQMQDEAAKQQASLAAATERSAAAARQLEQAQSQHQQVAAALNQTIDQQKQRLSDLQANLAQQRREHQSLTSQIATLQSQLAEAATAGEELKRQLAAARGEAQAANTETDR